MKAILYVIRHTDISVALLASSVTVGASGDVDDSFNRVGCPRNFVSDLTRSDGVAIHSSGEIVTLGAYFHGTSADLILWRHLTDGTLDTSFGGTGVIYPPSPPQFIAGGGTLVIDNLNRIVFVVLTPTNYVVYRLNFDGSLDLTFSGTGYVTVPLGTPTFAITGIPIPPPNHLAPVARPPSPIPPLILHPLLH